MEYLCDQCTTKATVGKLLSIFLPHNSDDYLANEQIIYNIMISQTFRTLFGSLRSFYHHVQHYESGLNALLRKNTLFNLSDLDENDDVDSTGNLR